MTSSNPSGHSETNSKLTRRGFLKTTSTAVVGSSLLTGLPFEGGVFAAGSDTLKLSLVGCGSRGTGAANQALSTAGSVKLVAMADVRPDQLEKSLQILQERQPGKIEVSDDTQFTAFDGYKNAIALADIVILASPPGFRPIHFGEAVRQGKHVFMEKPVATDAPGVRQVLAAAEEAKKKNLKVGVGLQRRHQQGYVEAVRRIQDGAVGEIMLLRAYWDGGARDGLERLPGETEMHYQIRNWYYFTWLSGDHIVEQHVHNLDVVNWIKNDYPVRGQGMGGRQVRNTKRHGQIFDHHFVEFEYADGTRMLSQCRQIPGCWPMVAEFVTGTRGTAELRNGRFFIKGPNAWRSDNKKKIDPYQQEHDDLFDAIRKNNSYNEAEFAAKSTMTGILGRMCTYSGQQVEWEDAFNSKTALVPSTFAWDIAPPVLPDDEGFYPIAVPGHTLPT